MYSLLFLLKGRGHDATEFQDAQSAVGVSYSGHFLDWLFVSITLLSLTLWILVSKPSLKTVLRTFVGAIVTFVFIVILQKMNNVIFDPLFAPPISKNVSKYIITIQRFHTRSSGILVILCFK